MGDLQVVGGLKVVDHGDLVTFEIKGLTRRRVVPNHFVNIIGALVAPIGNDRVARELHLDKSLELALVTTIVLDLDDAVKTSFCRHELENRVHDECTAHLTLKG